MEHHDPNGGARVDNLREEQLMNFEIEQREKEIVKEKTRSDAA